MLFIIIVCLAVILGPVLSQDTSSNSTIKWHKITTSKGDRLPDFSFSGYHASNQSLPDVTSTATATLAPAKGDQTQRIQRALNQTASAGGGVVALGKGNFTISAGLLIPSGVTLRGSSPADTKLISTQQPVDPVITLGSGGKTAKQLVTAKITDSYVPIGTSVLNVNDAAGFKVGQSVYVQRAVTANWVRYNGMSDLVRDGVKQTWIEVGKVIQQPNTISSIDGTKITLLFPLTDSLDATYMEPNIMAYTAPTLNSEIGIEQLSIYLTTSCSGSPVGDSACNGAAVSFSPWTVDSWARNLTLKGFNQFVDVECDASRITIQDVAMYRDAATTGVAIPSDIWIKGSRILVKDCGQYGLKTAEVFSVMTGSLTPGPNAVLRHVTQSTVQSIYPHQRWAHGLLVEDTSVPVLFVNRGTKGTGHGWSINGGAGWNLRGQTSFESAPLGINWCIGCNDQTGNGTYKKQDKTVKPQSLFESQLEARGLA
ncbi:hypothetical protein BGZ61DRAFT_366680 [Ilyonectria robusta]|uniref:uncharacterized protein n=1 Tax=Ilyonectria robusta TaxID=1079257 RepID=UPI001E8ED646|nr:uncharacterized protein BGZ61DRAFT_366680 [Ilyonectria robusta]KAH8665304.1 hypothetical protein BGZ61DRAFT_366680 [Ilyonectria robusta]